VDTGSKVNVEKRKKGVTLPLPSPLNPAVAGLAGEGRVRGLIILTLSRGSHDFGQEVLR
jgi:hypothetical protein